MTARTLDDNALIDRACRKHGIDRHRLLRRTPRYSTDPYLAARADIVRELYPDVTIKYLADMLNMSKAGAALMVRRTVTPPADRV